METSNNNAHLRPNSRLCAFLKITHILAFVCLVICSGCGTIIGRSGVGDMAYDVKIPRYYPATFVDSRLIAESSPNTSSGARALFCAGGVIDLPISLVLDTLLFPYDACKSSKQTSSTVSKPPEPIAEAEKNAKARQMLEAQNKPIELWAEVVDQDNIPLSGVKVEAEIGHFVWPPEQYPNGVSSNVELSTDVNGQFHIQDNSATSVGVTLQKDGYEQESLKGNGYALGGGGGSQANPMILKMWSTNTHQQLITGGNHFHIVPDGGQYFINLTDDTISESGGGDLKVWIQYTNQVVQGQLYDWSAGIEVINGGLQETNSDEMFIAPIDGYVPSFQLKGQIKGGQSGNIGDKRFYIMLKNGQEYGKIEIEMIAPYNLSMGIPGMIRLSYAINPSGSRILR